jgi:hypothetical protein
MKPCRECRHQVSENAFYCPGCGAPYPAEPKWDGWGFEYKSESSFFGWPLIHISFKYRRNRVPVPAKGIIAIGQFAIGAYVLAQFAFAYSCIAQIGIFIHGGTGQLVKKLAEIVGIL